MKKKIFMILALMCAFSAASFAQLTTGEPSAKKIRTGNRPEAGDYGLFIGASVNSFSNAAEYANPIVNLKYYSTDNLELRASIDANAYNERAFGKSLDEGTKYGAREADGQLLLVPGVAYHFGNMNILDVYAGAELPLGWTGYKAKHVEGDFSSISSKNAFTVGIGAFIGLQAFIANLPVAVGIEYGLSSQFDLGLKYKNTVKSGGQTEVSYELDESIAGISSSQEFSKLNARRGNLGQQVRIVFSYYFK